jgi:hypothetical protein
VSTSFGVVEDWAIPGGGVLDPIRIKRAGRCNQANSSPVERRDSFNRARKSPLEEELCVKRGVGGEVRST